MHEGLNLMELLTFFIQMAEDNPYQFFLLLLIAITVCVFIHECGHALAAAFCGVAIIRFRVGGGPTIPLGSLQGCTFEVGLIPGLGRVTYAAMPIRSWRQQAFCAAGGPLAVALAGFVVFGVYIVSGRTNLPLLGMATMLGVDAVGNLFLKDGWQIASNLAIGLKNAFAKKPIKTP